MTTLDDILNEIQFSYNAEKSLKDFNNWIFGISIGISGILIFQFNNIDLSTFCLYRSFYKYLIMFSMINTLLVGYNKYMIMKRETIMSIKLGTLRKVAFFSKIKESNPYEVAKETDFLFSEWITEYNKIKHIGILHNIAIINTLITIVATGILILIII